MFRFKLQAVLDHRQFIEDNLKKELADIRNRVAEAQQRMESMENKEVQTMDTVKQEQVQGISSDVVVSYQNYLTRLADQITGQQTMIDELKKMESEKKEEIQKAMKGRQILEKLKEQGLDRYRQLMSKKEMKFIDEIAVNQFVRKSLEEQEENG